MCSIQACLWNRKNATTVAKTKQDQADGPEGFSFSMIATRIPSAHGFSPSDTDFSWTLKADKTLGDFRNSDTLSTSYSLIVGYL